MLFIRGLENELLSQEDEAVEEGWIPSDLHQRVHTRKGIQEQVPHRSVIRLGHDRQRYRRTRRLCLEDGRIAQRFKGKESTPDRRDLCLEERRLFSSKGHDRQPFYRLWPCYEDDRRNLRTFHRLLPCPDRPETPWDKGVQWKAHTRRDHRFHPWL